MDLQKKNLELFSQPTLYRGSSTRRLRIGANGQGRIEIQDVMRSKNFRVTIYEDSPMVARESLITLTKRLNGVWVPILTASIDNSLTLASDPDDNP